LAESRESVERFVIGGDITKSLGGFGSGCCHGGVFLVRVLFFCGITTRNNEEVAFLQ
jgi:hypothetical protein